MHGGQVLIARMSIVIKHLLCIQLFLFDRVNLTRSLFCPDHLKCPPSLYSTTFILHQSCTDASGIIKGNTFIMRLC